MAGPAGRDGGPGSEQANQTNLRARPATRPLKTSMPWTHHHPWSATAPAPPPPWRPAGTGYAWSSISPMPPTDRRHRTLATLLEQQVLRLPAHWLEGLKRQGLGLNQAPPPAARPTRHHTGRDNQPWPCRPAASGLPSPITRRWAISSRPLTGASFHGPGSSPRSPARQRRRMLPSPRPLERGPVHSDSSRWGPKRIKAPPLTPAKPGTDRPKRFGLAGQARRTAARARPGASDHLIAPRRRGRPTTPRDLFSRAVHPTRPSASPLGRALRCPCQKRPPDGGGGGPGGWTCRGRQLHFAHWAVRRTGQRRQAQRRMGFGDLLTAPIPAPGQRARRTDRRDRGALPGGA